MESPVRAPVLALVFSAQAAWDRAEAWGRAPVPPDGGLEFDALLGAVTVAERPLLQRTARAGASGLRDWFWRIPGRAGGWGAGPERSWCTWGPGVR